MSVMNALAPAFVWWLGAYGKRFFTKMFNRPMIMGTLTGLLMGDVATGAIIGAEMEIMYMGVVSVGGVQATESAFATCFAAALVIGGGMSTEAAIAISIPAGLIGNMLDTVQKMLFSLVAPWYDSLIEKDKTKQFTVAYMAVPAVVYCICPIVLFVGLRLGSDVLIQFMDTMPGWVNTGLSAAGKMLPAVGMGILLNYLWRGNLVIYLLFGFATMAFIKTSNVYIAILGLMLAIIEFYRSYELKKVADRGVAIAQNNEEEDFFDE